MDILSYVMAKSYTDSKGSSGSSNIVVANLTSTTVYDPYSVTYSCDKTISELYNAAVDGKTVFLRYKSEGYENTDGTIYILADYYESNNYKHLHFSYSFYDTENDSTSTWFYYGHTTENGDKWEPLYPNYYIPKDTIYFGFQGNNLGVVEADYTPAEVYEMINSGKRVVGFYPTNASKSSFFCLGDVWVDYGRPFYNSSYIKLYCGKASDSYWISAGASDSQWIRHNPPT